MKRTIGYLFMVATVLAVVLSVGACTGGNGASQAQGVATSGAVESRFIGNTTVNLFQIVNGTPSTILFSATQTDATGHFSITAPQDGPFLVVATGTYGPPKGQTGQNVNLSLSAAAVNAGSFPATITLLSQAAVNYAETLGGLTTDNIQKADDVITNYALSVNPLSTPVLDYTLAQSATVNGSQKLLAAEFGALYLFQQTHGDTPGGVVDAIVASLTSGGNIMSSRGGGYIEDGTDPQSKPTNNTVADSSEGITWDFYNFLKSGTNATGLKSVNDFILAMGNPAGSQQAATSCTTSTNADFSQRSALQQSNVPNWQTTNQAGSWGPHSQPLPYVSVPAGCDCSTWKTQRVLQAIDMFVNMGLNYCHHHIPGWTPPDDEGQPKAVFRIPGTTCTKNRTVNGKIVWQGVDCSDFTSWYYNYALGVASGGIALHTAIDTQACEPNPTSPAPVDPNNKSCTIDGAPGVALNYNSSNFDSIAGKLQPGDLLFIMGGNGNTNITHVITWTGMTVGNGTGQIPTSKLAPDYQSYVTQGQQLAGAWVIADSHYAGPAYRPFLGWYRANLSHVRRIINQNNAPKADIIDPSTNPDFVYTPQVGNSTATCQRISFN